MAKLNRDEFVLQAILKLRSGRQKGLSTATAGLEEAFKHQYGEKADLLKHCAKMQAAGTLVMRVNGKPGHFTIYLPDEAPKQKRSAFDVLADMGIKVPQPKRTLVATS